MRLPAWLSLLTLCLILGCGIEFPNPGDDDSGSSTPTPSETEVTGVAAEGEALDNATLRVWDATGTTHDTTTDENGLYSLTLPAGTSFPVVLCVNNTESVYCSLIAEPAESGVEVTSVVRHINPVSTEVLRQQFSFDIPENLEQTPNTESLSLGETSWSVAGQSATDNVFGEGVQFSWFNDDQDYAARNSTTGIKPSQGDILLESMYSYVRDEGKTVQELFSLQLQGNQEPLGRKQPFQVSYTSKMLAAGYEQTEAKQKIREWFTDPYTISSMEQFIDSFGNVHSTGQTRGLDAEEQWQLNNAVGEIIYDYIDYYIDFGGDFEAQELDRFTQNLVVILTDEMVDFFTDLRDYNLDEETRYDFVLIVAEQTAYALSYIIVESELDEQTTDRIEQLVGDFLDEITYTLDVELEHIQTDPDYLYSDEFASIIQTEAESWAFEILEDEILQDWLQPEDRRPSEQPPVKKEHNSIGATVQDPIKLESESRVLEIHTLESAVQFLIVFYDEVNATMIELEFRGTLNENNDKVEGFIKVIEGEDVGFDGFLYGFLEAAPWSAKWEQSNKGLKFIKVSGDQFLVDLDADIKLQVGAEIKGRITFTLLGNWSNQLNTNLKTITQELETGAGHFIIHGPESPLLKTPERFLDEAIHSK